MATAEQIKEFLKDNPPASQFIPYCYISKEADALTVYFEGDADFSERLNDHITLYRSVETKEVVGCRIKGISGILEDMPNYIRVKKDGIELSVLFFAFRGGAEGAVRDTMNGLAKVAVERKLSLEPNSLAT